MIKIIKGYLKNKLLRLWWAKSRRNYFFTTNILGRDPSIILSPVVYPIMFNRDPHGKDMLTVGEVWYNKISNTVFIMNGYDRLGNTTWINSEEHSVSPKTAQKQT
jgi:hypothetical protein